MLYALLGFTLLPSLVSAHGFVSKVSIDGTSYTGNTPYGATNPSSIRQVNTNGPVKGATNPNLSCGNGAQPASESAAAMPGSSVSFYWVGGVTGDATHWPHYVGPMLTYMASCGSTSCDKFDSQNAEWFKIDEVGQNQNGDGWVQKELNDGQPATVTIPSNLAAGNYLIRHEIIALHNAMSEGGAEFYPSCTQLKVGGNGTGGPSSNDLVSLPGAYSDTEPGILFNAYEGMKYTAFPGPEVVKLGTATKSQSSISQTSKSQATATACTCIQHSAVTASSSSAPSATGTASSTCRALRFARQF